MCWIDCALVRRRRILIGLRREPDLFNRITHGRIGSARSATLWASEQGGAI